MLLTDLLDLRAHDAGERTAVIASTARVTFAGLLARTHALATGLSCVTQPGDRVCLLADNGVEYVECYYGVPAAGRTLVPLNTRLHVRELVEIGNDAQASILIYGERYREAAETLLREVPTINSAYSLEAVTSGPSYEGLFRPGRLDTLVTPDSIAWIVYTSGTTGRPKGAMLTQRNLVTSVLNSASNWGRARRQGPLLMPWPMFHVAGYAVLVHHMSGSPVILPAKFEAATFLDLIQRHGVAEMTLAPTMLNMLLTHEQEHPADLSSLARLFYGSSGMPRELLERTMRRLPEVDFWSGFGMTEIGGNVAFLTPDDHRRARQEPRLLSSAGRASGLGTVAVLDERGDPVPPGTVGEIGVRGEQVSVGYWPSRKSAIEQTGWLATGDLAHQDTDGYLFIVDRSKDMIISGGENVYSVEVEQVLHKHPLVYDCAVVGVPDPKWGEAVVACVQLQADATVSEAELIEYCRGSLAGYKTPKHVLFIPQLPLGPTGKVLKRELRQTAPGVLADIARH